MATTRQMFSYHMLFGSCILLIMGTTSEEAATNNTMVSDVGKPIVTHGQMENATNAPAEHPQSPSPSSVKYSSTSNSKGMGVEPKVSPQQLRGPETLAPVSKSGEKVLKSLVPSTTIRPPSLGKSVSNEQGTKADASYIQSINEQAIVNTKAGVVQQSPTAIGKVMTSTGIMVTVSTTLRSKFSLETSDKPRYKGKETEMAAIPGQHKSDHHEKEMATTPGQHKPDHRETEMTTTPGQHKSHYPGTDMATTPGQHNPDHHETEMATTPVQHNPDHHETSSTSSHRPHTTIMRDTTTQETESVSPNASSSGNKHIGITLAVVCCILILLALMAFLYHRHRRHSGSTDFNAAGWAGQVALPDDSGLERDIEQEAVAVPEVEGGTRRNTLVTFFGKRQSRLPSVAMEDITGKGEGEECQQLLDEDTGTVCTPEAVGEANGKIAETSVSSHEASTPSNTGGGS